MNSNAHTSYESVLAFWFGAIDDDGLAPAALAKRWWRSTEDFDDEIRERFEADHKAVLAGERDDWLDSARGRVAFVIVLDQFSRNMHRNTPGMFAADELARRITLETIELDLDRSLPVDLRAFLYMPLMHSEDPGHQDRCIEIFQRLHDELTGRAKERIAANLKAAEHHRDIVAAWGRFPHRNAILGRPSTPAEREFLTQPGSSF